MKDSKLILRRVSDEIVEKNNICVSAFGIGKDFDEELMKGIAEYGKGSYFFIEGPATIPTFVEFALMYILNSIATESVLRIYGENGCIVNKLYGNYSLEQGAWLGDIRENNERSVLCKFNARGDVTEDEITAIRYELVYKDRHGNEQAMMGELKLKYTDNNDVIQDIPEVMVKVVIQKTANIDKKLIDLLNKDDESDKVVELQQSQINLFESVVDLDREFLGGKNRIESMLARARESLENLKDKQSRQKEAKEVHHRGYMKTRG